MTSSGAEVTGESIIGAKNISRTEAFTEIYPTTTGKLIKDEPRTTVWRDVSDSGESVVIKMYHHGGKFTYIRKKLCGFRTEREYRALAHLMHRGINCSAPLSWSHGKSATRGSFEALTTREIAGAKSLRALGASIRCLNLDLAQLYDSVRRMHESGLFHAVLHVDNVLTVPAGGMAREFFVIDMPRAIVLPYSIVGTRMAWFDLQYLTFGIHHELNVPLEKIPLNAYGLDERSKRRLLDTLPGFSRSKFRRKRLRAEALLKLCLSRFGLGRERSLSTSDS